MNHSLPPLGISLARSLGEKLTEVDIRECADKIVKCGLRDAGYEYVIIPDTWCKSRRCLKTDSLVCDTERFPSTLSGISEQLHSMGLKLGVVMTLGSRSSSDRPGIFDREWADVEYFDNAGVDYIAVDMTHLPARAELETPLRRLGMAIRTASRPIFYAVYACEDIHAMAASTGINSYCLRTFDNAATACELSLATAGYSADFCFESCGDISVCDTERLRAQLITAAAMSSPVIVDCDVRCITEEQLSVLLNSDMIKVARDREVRPARCLSEGVYVKALESNRYAIAFVNSSDELRRFAFSTYDFGLTWNAGLAAVATRIFGGDSITFTDGIEETLPAHSASMYLMELTER